ncbi:hypothetical protein D3C71_1958340 [compost metagenome]
MANHSDSALCDSANYFPARYAKFIQWSIWSSQPVLVLLWPGQAAVADRSAVGESDGHHREHVDRHAADDGFDDWRALDDSEGIV